MRDITIGKISPTFLKLIESAKQDDAKYQPMSDDFKVKLSLEMRDKIFATCKKELLRYDDLMTILGLSRDQAFKLMRNSSFPVRQVNGCNTVTAIALAHWMLENSLTT